ncbi:permease [Paenibacillus sp. NPDC093718]|uniref:permease n=1 Tax=Paenibacillus sp. NPDC093718 TaxID=3390601 RepID=UPI003D081C3D
MRNWLSKSGLNLLFTLLVLSLIYVALFPDVISNFSLTAPNMDKIQTFKTMLISIVLEALPYILIGVFVSSLIQLYVSEKWIARFCPKNPILGIVFACTLGIIFPICECGMIPVVRRLMMMGMPLYIGVVFILVGPIVNPVVYASTYQAFRLQPEILYSRMGLALIVGFIIGLLIYKFVSGNPLKHTEIPPISSGSDASHQHAKNKFLIMMDHAAKEFFDVGKYLIIGSILTAAIQAFIPRDFLVQIGQGEIGSHLFMMGFAFILSICSTSDAFVASSFLQTFSASSIVSFLVFGPMVDFKSTLMLLSVFNRRFVVQLVVLIGMAVLFLSIMLGQMIS